MKYNSPIKKGLLFICALFLSNAIVAQRIDKDHAQAIASKFFATPKNSVSQHLTNINSPSLVSTYGEVSNGAALYVFNNSPRGFVVVGGTDDNPTIVGYSRTNTYDVNHVPEALKWWMKEYEKSGSASQETMLTNRVSISPLLSTKWGQDEPFNNAIPSVGPEYYPFSTGCTATSLAQIMKYYEYPVHGIGSNSYTIDYGVKKLNFTADFSQAHYDWEHMRDDYRGDYTQEEANAVATLMYHVGVAEQTIYSGNGSSAYTDDGPKALINNFDYDKSIQTADREYFSDEDWEQIIYDELSVGRPILYSGARQSADGEVGHSFIIHGYDSEYNLFAINWGWNGHCDGFFPLVGHNPLNPYAEQIDGPSMSNIYSNRDGVVEEQNVRPTAMSDYMLVDGGMCDRGPELEYCLVSLNEGKTYKMEGVAADGVSCVRIELTSGSYLPPASMGFEYKWTLSEPVGTLSNTDIPNQLIYTAPAEYEWEGTDYSHTITAYVNYSNGDPRWDGKDSIDIKIIRVPVVLVHGLNANDETWDKFKKYLLTMTRDYQPFQVFVANYEDTNTAGFMTNVGVVKDAISCATENCRTNGYAATKCDVIGHSMGGILARLHVEYANGASTVNKIITVNTPHSGSVLGDMFGDLTVNFANKWKEIKAFFNRHSDMTADAIKDLGVNSAATDLYLNNPKVLDKMNGIPVHAISTWEDVWKIGSIALSAPSGLISTLLDLVVIYIELGYWADMDMDSSDLIVTTTSQQGGLPDGYITSFPHQWHCSSPQYAGAHIALHHLLLASKDDRRFCTSGFHPVDLVYDAKNSSNRHRTNSLPETVADDLELHVDHDVDSLYVHFVDRDNFEYGLTCVGLGTDSILYFRDASFHCPIPSSFSGRIDVISLGRNDDGVIHVANDSLFITDSRATLDHIEVENVEMAEGDMIHIKARCGWSDGTQTMAVPQKMTGGMNVVTYRNGRLSANAPGTVNVTFYYMDSTCECTVRVEPNGQPIVVTEDQLYHAEIEGEPGYNLRQSIFYHIIPNEGGEYSMNIASREEIVLATSKDGEPIYSYLIDGPDDNDVELFVRFRPYNSGLEDAKFQYGVLLRNVCNGETVIAPRGTTDNLKSGVLHAGASYTNTLTASFRTSILPSNGVFEVLPAYCAEGSVDWQPMLTLASDRIPVITVMGNPSSNQTSLPLSLSGNRMQVGKHLIFSVSPYYQGRIFFTSSNPDIAEVTSDGQIVGISVGHAMINAEILGDENFYPDNRQFEVEVVEHVVNPLLLTLSSSSLNVGEEAHINSDKDYDGIITYKAVPDGIVRVTSDGTIAALHEGQATIHTYSSATYDYNATYNAFTVDVKPNIAIEEEDLVISQLSIGEENVIFDGHSHMKLTIMNNTDYTNRSFTFFYRIFLDHEYIWTGSVKGTISARGTINVDRDLFDFKTVMTPGNDYECYFYKDALYKQPMNISSTTFHYGEISEIPFSLIGYSCKTLSLPFDSNIPLGMQAYEVKAYYDELLLLSEVPYLKRNHSYIVCGEAKNYTFNGVVIPTFNNPTYGFMTGLHTDRMVPQGQYVTTSGGISGLQRLDVEEEREQWTAYLSLPQEAPSLLQLILPEGAVNSISTSKNEDGKDSIIVDLEGRILPVLKKGINLIKKADGSVVKLLVK